MKDTSSLVVEIIEFTDSIDQLKLLEEKYIAQHIGNFNNLNFNNTACGFASGELNWSKSLEARELKSKLKKGLTLDQQFGIEKSLVIRDKISKSHTGIKTGKPAWNAGLSPTLETRKKISAAGLRNMRLLSDTERQEKFGRIGESNGFYGKTHSPATLTRLSNTQKQNRIHNRKICDHCAKSIDAANFARYHGDKCKLKHDSLPSQHISTGLNDQA